MNASGGFALPIVRVASLASELVAWLDVLREHGGLVLRGAAGEPSHQGVMDLGRALGQPRKSVVGTEQDTDNLIHEVRPRNQTVNTDFGRPIRSTGFEALSFHTDGYNADKPPRIVLLQVAVPGTGGLTTAAKVSDVVDVLRPSSVQRLMLLHYPFVSGVTRILWQDDDFWCMRFNFFELQPLISGRFNADLITGEDATALSELNEVLDYLESLSENRTLLRRGDVLVLDNRRVLHGRLSLHEGDSERLLHRVWCD